MMTDIVNTIKAQVLRNYVSNKMFEFGLMRLDDKSPYQQALIDMNKEAERLAPTVMD